MAFAALAVFVAALPAFISDVKAQQFAYVGIYLIALLGLNILTGYTGQISLGHGAFMAIGGYTTVILMVGNEQFGGSIAGGVRDVWTIPAAGLVAGLVGLAFGLPALRLSGLYLALATFAVAVAMPSAIKRFDSFTGGGTGVNLFGKPELTGGLTGVDLLGRHLSFNLWLYYLCWSIALVALPSPGSSSADGPGARSVPFGTARRRPSPPASASPATRRSPSGSARPTRESPAPSSRSRTRTSTRTPFRCSSRSSS